MPDAPSTPAPLTCPACSFGNPAHSLFCQDCGARLPVAPPSYVTQAAAPSVPAKPAKKPRILSRHRTGATREILGITLRTLVYAAVAALCIQMVRAPRSLPPATPGLSAENVTQELANLTLNAGQGRAIRPTWVFLNGYLAGRLVSAGDAPSGFVRANLVPRANGFTLYVHKRVARIPIYTTIDFRVIARTNGLSLEPTGAAIGRLPLPAWAAGLVLSMNAGIADALHQEVDILRSARDATITPEAVRIDFSPSAP